MTHVPIEHATERKVRVVRDGVAVVASKHVDPLDVRAFTQPVRVKIANDCRRVEEVPIVEVVILKQLASVP